MNADNAPALLPPPDWMPDWLIAPLVGGFSTADLLGLLILLMVVLNFVMFEIWLERKIGGRIQLRLGPMHVGPHGALQSPADVLKLLTKEDLTPRAAEKRIFKMAPYIVFVPVFMTFLVIPWGPVITFQNLLLRPFDLALLYIVAIPALQGLGLVMAGWSSGNKYSLLGAARVVAQLISYEVPMVIALLGVAMLAETLSLSGIVDAQRQSLWYIFLQPIGFLVFFTAAMSEMSRTPFDIALAESEIVGGPFLEYSGMRWGMFYLAEFSAVFLNAALATALFLGGWQFLPGLDLLPELGVLWFMGKVLVLVIAVQWARFTLPRLRIDQLMDLAWKMLLPASIVNLILTAVLQTFGFLAFGVGITITLLVALALLVAYRGRRRPERGIRLMSVTPAAGAAPGTATAVTA
jgi:NADH-quinone oxidoreductase subunit H